MANGTTSADPDLLERFRAADQAIDDGLLRRAGALADRLHRLRASGSVGLPALDGWPDRVRRHALASSELATWVGAVATAFRGADEGSVPVPPSSSWPGLASLVHLLAAGPGVVTGAALAARLHPLLASGSIGAAMVATIAALLTPGQRHALALEDPTLVGPVDGWPAPDRYAANRVLIERASVTATGVDRDRLQAFLEDDPRTGRPRQFLLFDPRKGGRVAEVFGDLATATSVGIVVPGMGTDIDHFDTQVAPRARNLYEASTELYGDQRFATIGWLGYDAPADLPSHQVVDRRQALDGGHALTAFVEGLHLSLSTRVTLVGHSYGTVVLGAALKDGVRADNVLAMGSPGMGVHRAADFGRGGATRFFTMEAPGDWITDLERFGHDPNEPDSGFERLETGGHGHSSYLTTSWASQLNAAAVMADDDEGLRVRRETRSESVADRLERIDHLVPVDGLLDRWQDEHHLGPLNPVINQLRDQADPVHRVADTARTVERGADVLGDATRFLFG